MKLYDYDVLLNDVFYKSEHILEYIENHDLSKLDIEAIKATIMDALVYFKLINPEEDFLNFEKLEITKNSKDYQYEKTPNISGIPMFMKEEFRKHSLYITGSIPISLFLARPADKITRYCVYDPNTAVSSIFDDFTFCEAVYISLTRGVKLEETRPFVEVTINDEKYMVDILTKRIIKTSFFKEKYGLEIKKSISKKDFDKERRDYYKESVEESNNLSSYLIFLMPVLNMMNKSNWSEMKYEVEKSKEYYPDEWKNYYFDFNSIKKMTKEEF